jgi:endonuclease/exonuclease/phosphatase family metal-dependent hydrolase
VSEKDGAKNDMKRLGLAGKSILPIYKPVVWLLGYNTRENGETGPTGCEPDPGSDTGLSLNIMSFNIRRGTAKDRNNHWIFRRNLVHQILDLYRPDVLGLQEAMDFQIAALRRMLPGYAMVGSGGLGGSEGMHTAIFFNETRFSLFEEGTFWLSDTPDVPGSKGWGNILPRTCTWVRLIEKESGQGFYFYNTHLNHISQRSRKKSVVFLAQRIQERAFQDPFVLMGDFNARERSAPIKYLKGKVHLNMKARGGSLNPVPLLDTFRQRYPKRRNVVTFHGFRRFLFRFRLDYIFVPSIFKVHDVKIIQLRWKKCYPSDHFPILTRIEIPASLTDLNSDHGPDEKKAAPKSEIKRGKPVLPHQKPDSKGDTRGK